MKKDIHPKCYPESTVKCGCGAAYTIASTIPHMEVDICSNCHPFYTGAKKLVDVAGRVEKFQERLRKTEQMKKVIKGKKTVVRNRKTVEKTENGKN